MKKFFIVIFTLLLAAPLYSQVKFGIKAGVSTDFPYSSQELIGEGVDLVLEDLENAQWGFQGGAFLRAAFGGFYVLQTHLPLKVLLTDSLSMKSLTRNLQSLIFL